jgi:hypothetical protein
MQAALKKVRPDPEVVLGDGTSARVEETEDGQALTVRDPVGRMIFQYDPATGRAAVFAPAGDLCLCAPRGAIDLVAGRGIRAVSGGDIDLAGTTAARLRVHGKETSSSLRLEGACAALESESLRVRALESELHLGDARAFAERLRAAVDTAELTCGKVLRSAERVIEQAQDFYQRVSDLYEQKVGRLRAIAREGVRFEGRDLVLLADDDVRVDGKHINLG